MTAVTFDTLAFSDKLKESGMPPAQAEAQARAMAAAFDASRQDLATKADIDTRFVQAKADMDVRFAKVEGELLLLKWMLGVVVAGVLALVMKAFLHA